ncbi:hypothetical protein FRACA_1330004 [Frankia canadensis]|uniref:Uncharacterized protein n=1 Tax=Frankia canadensis TaxID=1836972 RepID=A0A2I2KKU7_9ACTN|nr:hypothetical protein FRACA_1330004 [Frankia canadensis]SOU53575.1 hypothetical protein FRACA_1330004 [Frankia canadensis]
MAPSSRRADCALFHAPYSMLGDSPGGVVMVFAVPLNNVRHSSGGTPNPAPGRRFLTHRRQERGNHLRASKGFDALGVKP